MKTLLWGLLVAGLAVGCNKGAGDAPAKGDAPKTEAKPATSKPTKGAKPAEKPASAPATKAAPAAAKAWLKIEKYGVQIEAPAGAEAKPGAGSSLMIFPKAGACTIMLAKKDDTAYFESYDSAKKTIDKGITGKKKEMFIDEKKDADNWTIFYSKAGMIDPAKTQFAVDVRSKVGDGLYSCGRVTNQKADAECVLAACKSIKPL